MAWTEAGPRRTLETSAAPCSDDGFFKGRAAVRRQQQQTKRLQKADHYRPTGSKKKAYLLRALTHIFTDSGLRSKRTCANAPTKKKAADRTPLTLKPTMNRITPSNRQTSTCNKSSAEAHRLYYIACITDKGPSRPAPGLTLARHKICATDTLLS